jgi:hypothetical protein
MEVQKMNIKIIDETKNYKRDYVKFINNIYNYALENDFEIRSTAERTYSTFGNSLIAIYKYNNEVQIFEMFYDFDYDPDYPNREWFITLRYDNKRADFETFEEAVEFMKNFIKRLKRNH